MKIVLEVGPARWRLASRFLLNPAPVRFDPDDGVEPPALAEHVDLGVERTVGAAVDARVQLEPSEERGIGLVEVEADDEDEVVGPPRPCRPQRLRFWRPVRCPGRGDPGLVRSLRG
ncbi:MAG: hypothetical protein IPM79_36180 [Polyangiaceae bacterium]|nr:hypothetical protein [Polyangiaceae bacterium]